MNLPVTETDGPITQGGRMPRHLHRPPLLTRPCLWGAVDTLPGNVPVTIAEARLPDDDGVIIRGYLITMNERSTYGAVERHHIRYTTGEPADLLWHAMRAGDPRIDPSGYTPWWDPDHPADRTIIDELVEQGRITPAPWLYR